MKKVRALCPHGCHVRLINPMLCNGKLRKKVDVPPFFCQIVGLENLRGCDLRQLPGKKEKRGRAGKRRKEKHVVFGIAKNGQNHTECGSL